MRQTLFTVAFLLAGFLCAREVTAQGYNLSAALQYYRSQNWNALSNYARRWSSASPNDSKPWFCLGEAAYHTGNWDEAIEGFSKATKLSPSEPKPWNNLSAAYCKKQQWSQAMQALNDGEAASKGMCTATDWYVFGNGHKELRD